MALRRSKTNPSGYAILLDYGLNGGTDDTELWREDLQTGTWYDFVLHLRFSQTAGVIELWIGHDGGAKTQVVSSAGATLYADGEPVRFHWSFGDGSGANGASVTHRYSNGGRKKAVLTVTDFRGLFLLPCLIATGAAVALALFFHPPKKQTPTLTGDLALAH